MLELINRAIREINNDLKIAHNIHYHFYFNQFEYESEYHTIIRYEIQAISNIDNHAKVDLISESAQVSAIETTLMDGSLFRAKEILLQRFITSVFKILLLGVGSPLIIELENKVQKKLNHWNDIKKLIEDNTKRIKDGSK